ncbi:MAG TPA: VWA domain-containing protein [Terriglobia bacterium]|nr:VWA domain-containing protein [Terriglobia bacterium]
MLRKIFALILCGGLCGVLSLDRLSAKSAQDNTLKLDVNLVNVFTTVTNPRGEFVTGLSRDDFRIFEDDVEQKISIFEKDDQVESAFGVLIDNSGSMIDILPIMKTGVLDFAQKARRTDEFFVMTFGTRAQVMLETHQPVRNLDAAFRTLQAQGICVLFDALIQGMTKVSKSDQERKALIVFTDGNDNGSKAGFGAVSLAAQRSSVLLYFVPIGPRVHIDQTTVESLAKLSGGRVIYLEKTDPIRPAMESIRTDLAKQYYLGYYAPVRPGVHHIRVEAPGRDVRIRAKTGYVAS